MFPDIFSPRIKYDIRRTNAKVRPVKGYTKLRSFLERATNHKEKLMTYNKNPTSIYLLKITLLIVERSICWISPSSLRPILNNTWAIEAESIEKTIINTIYTLNSYIYMP
jgi:hypothetical protein